MKRLLETLIFLKENKIIHRDIKQDNIIFKYRNFKLKNGNSNNYPKMIDFGLSTFTDQGQIIYRRVGSPGFTAPEILRLGSKGPVTYDFMADIYTMGLLFCFMKTGKNPFWHEDSDTVLARNKDNKINFNKYSMKMGQYPFEFFKKMVATDPRDRLTAEQ
jgi:serine/threonine protein kinase